MSEAEVIRNIASLLEKVRQGLEVVIEQDHQAVAVITPASRSGRPASEILREAKQRDLAVTLDAEFGKDLQAIIESHEQP